MLWDTISIDFSEPIKPNLMKDSVTVHFCDLGKIPSLLCIEPGKN